MKIIQLLNLLIQEAKDYRKKCKDSILKNKHMNNLKEEPILSQDTIDAILTDFINNIASKNNVDLALYSKDLT